MCSSLQKSPLWSILATKYTSTLHTSWYTELNMEQVTTHNLIPRPPVVTVMGHIDHGKSTLLDYIRKTKVTESEAGGITQHISAYEVEHTTPTGEMRRITFLDTPGHEAFQHLRSRGSTVADLAILVVAADDGVKPQTLEALKAITEARIPYLVAISKIDKANADIERAKMSLLEHGVYLEGLGGSVPFVPISSKTGEGVPALLDLLLLAADLEELQGDPTIPAQGLVIESHCDPKRGISAVLVIKNGNLKTGQYVVAGSAVAPLRIMEDFRGKRITSATFSSPLMVVGFSDTPTVGATFEVVADKKVAQAQVVAHTLSEHMEAQHSKLLSTEDEQGVFTLPIIIKSDVVGSIDAIKHELHKYESETTQIRTIYEGVGGVVEADVKQAVGTTRALIIGFNVPVDTAAEELAQRQGVEIARFQIIYELADWIPGAIAARRPKVRSEKILSEAKVLKCFSFTKKMQTLGCRVESGTLSVGDRVVLRRGTEEIGRGNVDTLKSGKSDVSHIEAGNDCGALIDMNLDDEPHFNDRLIAFKVTEE
jgi:translation initiation factor IF-2